MTTNSEERNAINLNEGYEEQGRKRKNQEECSSSSTKQKTEEKKPVKYYETILNDCLEEIMDKKAILDFHLDEAIKSYPNSEYLKIWKQKYEEDFQFKKQTIIVDEQTEFARPNLVNEFNTPYYLIPVDPNTHETETEKNVAEWLFSFTGDDTEEIFQSTSGQISIRVMLESLIPNSEPFANVIDTFCHVLNCEERTKTNNIPKRFYCSTEVLPHDILEEKFDVKKNEAIFSKNMIHDLRKNEYTSLMGNVDLVFFPVVRSNHYYVICFDLRYQSMHILDNSSAKESIAKRYQGVPEIVQKLFINYLKENGDERDRSLECIKPKRELMRWRNTRNNKDCSIFMMLHMETFSGGENVKNWDCGLDHQYKIQKNQLLSLRLKYLSKILLSYVNIKRNHVIEEVKYYLNLDPSAKTSYLNKKESEMFARFRNYS